MAENLDYLTSKLVKDYVRFDNGNFVLVHDNAQVNIACSIIKSLYNIVPEDNVTSINMDSYRRNEKLKELPREVISYIKSSLKPENFNTNVLLYLNAKRDGEPNLGRELIDLCQPLGKIGGLPGCTIDVLQAGYSEKNNPDFVKELYDFLQQEKEILITSDLGTKVTINIDTDKYKWVMSDGVLIPGKYGNPIPAEVYTYPADVNGRFVITGSYGHFTSLDKYKNNFDQLVNDLKQTPLIWDIKHGEITNVTCRDEFLQKEGRAIVFETDSVNGKKIGEIGHPANLYILDSKLTGNLLLDEKGRVHMANGDGYQKRTGCEYESKVHSDGLGENITLHSKRLKKNYMIYDKYNPTIFKTLQD